MQLTMSTGIVAGVMLDIGHDVDPGGLSPGPFFLATTLDRSTSRSTCRPAPRGRRRGRRRARRATMPDHDHARPRPCPRGTSSRLSVHTLVAGVDRLAAAVAFGRCRRPRVALGARDVPGRSFAAQAVREPHHHDTDGAGRASGVARACRQPCLQSARARPWRAVLFQLGISPDLGRRARPQCGAGVLTASRRASPLRRAQRRPPRAAIPHHTT